MREDANIEHQESKKQSGRDPAFAERDDAQQQELRAQRRGDVGDELKGFVKEVAADVQRFPKDVEEDAKDPERRVDDQQGVPVHAEAEPKSST